MLAVTGNIRRSQYLCFHTTTARVCSSDIVLSFIIPELHMLFDFCGSQESWRDLCAYGPWYSLRLGYSLRSSNTSPFDSTTGAGCCEEKPALSLPLLYPRTTTFNLPKKEDGRAYIWPREADKKKNKPHTQKTTTTKKTDRKNNLVLPPLTFSSWPRCWIEIYFSCS